MVKHLCKHQTISLASSNFSAVDEEIVISKALQNNRISHVSLIEDRLTNYETAELNMLDDSVTTSRSLSYLENGEEETFKSDELESTADSTVDDCHSSPVVTVITKRLKLSSPLDDEGIGSYVSTCEQSIDSPRQNTLQIPVREKSVEGHSQVRKSLEDEFNNCVEQNSLHHSEIQATSVVPDKAEVSCAVCNCKFVPEGLKACLRMSNRSRSTVDWQMTVYFCLYHHLPLEGIEKKRVCNKDYMSWYNFYHNKIKKAVNCSGIFENISTENLLLNKQGLEYGEDSNLNAAMTFTSFDFQSSPSSLYHNDYLTSVARGKHIKGSLIL